MEEKKVREFKVDDKVRFKPTVKIGDFGEVSQLVFSSIKKDFLKKRQTFVIHYIDSSDNSCKVATDKNQRPLCSSRISPFWYDLDWFEHVEDEEISETKEIEEPATEPETEVEETPKFKVGDKVRIKPTRNYVDIAGQLEITYIDSSDGTCKVKGHEYWLFWEWLEHVEDEEASAVEEIEEPATEPETEVEEAPEFKVGDRVKLKPHVGLGTLYVKKDRYFTFVPSMKKLCKDAEYLTIKKIEEPYSLCTLKYNGLTTSHNFKYALEWLEHVEEEPATEPEVEEAPEFKVGDRVKLKSSVEVGQFSSNGIIRFSPYAKADIDDADELKITYIDSSDETCWVEGQRFWFALEWLEHVEDEESSETKEIEEPTTEPETEVEEAPEFKIGDKVRIKPSVEVGHYSEAANVIFTSILRTDIEDAAELIITYLAHDYICQINGKSSWFALEWLEHVEDEEVSGTKEIEEPTTATETEVEEAPKFKVGDKVRIKPSVGQHSSNGELRFTSLKKRYIYEVDELKITYIDDIDGTCKINGQRFWFALEWLEHVEEEESSEAKEIEEPVTVTATETKVEEAPNFKVGDRVKLKSHVELGILYREEDRYFCFNPEMKKLCKNAEYLTIKKIEEPYSICTLKYNGLTTSVNFKYALEWLEHVDKEEEVDTEEFVLRKSEVNKLEYRVAGTSIYLLMEPKYKDAYQDFHQCHLEDFSTRTRTFWGPEKGQIWKTKEGVHFLIAEDGYFYIDGLAGMYYTDKVLECHQLVQTNATIKDLAQIYATNILQKNKD